MSFVVRNEGFTCDYCGEVNPPALRTCRNHCRKCLCSQHVDLASPGDRQSECFGKMKPVGIESDAKREWMIVHECEKCEKRMRNKMTKDDDFEKLVKLTSNY